MLEPPIATTGLLSTLIHASKLESYRRACPTRASIIRPAGYIAIGAVTTLAISVQSSSKSSKSTKRRPVGLPTDIAGLVIRKSTRSGIGNIANESIGSYNRYPRRLGESIIQRPAGAGQSYGKYTTTGKVNSDRTSRVR